MTAIWKRAPKVICYECISIHFVLQVSLKSVRWFIKYFGNSHTSALTHAHAHTQQSQNSISLYSYSNLKAKKKVYFNNCVLSDHCVMIFYKNESYWREEVAMKRQLMYSHETMIQTDNSNQSLTEDVFCSCKCLLRAQSAESLHPPLLSSLRNASVPVTAVLNSPHHRRARRGELEQAEPWHPCLLSKWDMCMITLGPCWPKIRTRPLSFIAKEQGRQTRP